jgi:hypothetical protein
VLLQLRSAGCVLTCLHVLLTNPYPLAPRIHWQHVNRSDACTCGGPCHTMLHSLLSPDLCRCLILCCAVCLPKVARQDSVWLPASTCGSSSGKGAAPYHCVSLRSVHILCSQHLQKDRASCHCDIIGSAGHDVQRYAANCQQRWLHTPRSTSDLGYPAGHTDVVSCLLAGIRRGWAPTTAHWWWRLSGRWSSCSTGVRPSCIYLLTSCSALGCVSPVQMTYLQ